jgi:WD40 repeat-containing protein SMU1
MNPGNNDSQLLTITSADVLRLIQAHLTEAGLHQTCQTLLEESGVGLAGSAHTQWYSWAVQGQWALILQSLASIDRERAHLDLQLLGQVHEITILELAAEGEWELAYATYRLVQHDLGRQPAEKGEKGDRMTLARLVEQKLADLASRRQKDPKAALPHDYYGTTKTIQQRREDLGTRLQACIPVQPKNRLESLLQQSVKWQVHTGQLPRIRQWWENEDKPSLKKKKRKVFDLVLGEVQVDPTMVGQEPTIASKLKPEHIPVDPYSTILIGKKATVEAAVFLPDGSGLITGSSDGLIEIWDPALQFTKLRMDLPYQQRDELLGHDSSVTALAVSADGTMLASGSVDGTVQVWRLDTGKALRQLTAHDAPIASLSFSPDSSHLLTAGQNGTCREFGLRTSRMMQEYRGHSSYLTSCFYQLQVINDVEVLLVVTSSGDGTVRLWNAKSSETIRVLRPQSLGKLLSVVGSSIVVDHMTSVGDERSPVVHTVVPLHTPINTMIVVPRGMRAFLVNYQGVVLQTFSADIAQGKVFVAAAVSPCNRSLYAVQDDGVCWAFDLTTGEMLQTIRDFGAESTSHAKGSLQVAEISSLIHHPHKHIFGAFSNDKGQKRGKLVLWK